MKLGDLLELTWLDACYYHSSDELSESAIKAGGERLFLIGVLVGVTKRSVVICSELDENRAPFRDFNLIPKRMIEKIKILKRNFGKVSHE